MSLITLTNATLSLVLAPNLGGAVASFRSRGYDILRPLPDVHSKVNQAGCFPLIPYSNRIALGQFSHQGQSFQLEKNFGDHPHSIHGNGWQNQWDVSEQSPQSVCLRFKHDAENGAEKAWPWSYVAFQTFRLIDNMLQITLTYHNLACVDVPVGLGFHPYFANASQSTLQFSAKKVLINGDDALPITCEAIPEQWDYQIKRPAPPNSVDNCFIDWSGVAYVHWPQQRLTAEIASHDMKHLVVFVPGLDKNFVAIEPVSHATNAINHPVAGEAAGMKMLASGKQYSVSMSIKVIHHDETNGII